MQNSLDRRVFDGRSIADIVMAPLAAMGISPTVVDVGARNGMHLLPQAYARHSVFVGFEPNPSEYEKLVNDTTDAKKAGLSGPKFKQSEFFNCALWDSVAERNFFVTVGTGACTIKRWARRCRK